MTDYSVELLQLCEYSIFSNDGKFSIMGIFDRVFVDKTPATHPRMFVTAIVRGKPNSSCDFVIEFMGPDGQLTKNKAISMKISLGQNGKGNVANEYIGLTLNEVGEHTVRLRINGEVMSEIPLYVQKVSNDKSGKPSN